MTTDQKDEGQLAARIWLPPVKEAPAPVAPTATKAWAKVSGFGQRINAITFTDNVELKSEHLVPIEIPEGYELVKKDTSGGEMYDAELTAAAAMRLFKGSSIVVHRPYLMVVGDINMSELAAKFDTMRDQMIEYLTWKIQNPSDGVLLPPNIGGIQIGCVMQPLSIEDHHTISKGYYKKGGE